MQRYVLLAAGLLIWLTACAGETGGDMIGGEIVGSQVQSGPISFVLPEGWRERPIKSEAVANGVLGADRSQWALMYGMETRTPLSVTLRLKDHPPELSDLRKRGDAVYSVQDLTADGMVGSGGPEYLLTAARPIGPKWLHMSAYQQSESGPPAFTSSWDIFESAAWTSSESAREK